MKIKQQLGDAQADLDAAETECLELETRREKRGN
jgi:hypothetical protein